MILDDQDIANLSGRLASGRRKLKSECECGIYQQGIATALKGGVRQMAAVTGEEVMGMPSVVSSFSSLFEKRKETVMVG